MVPPSANERVVDLQNLARSHFLHLTDAELKLLSSAIQGEIAACGPNLPTHDVANDPISAMSWGTEGQVRLSAARIGGNLECDGATLVNPARPDDSESGLALIADGAIITGGVFLRNGFSAAGEVRLIGSQIGSLDCSNGTFKNPPQQR